MAFLGELLVEAGLITETQLAEALRAKAVFGGRIGTNLVELGIIDDATLHLFLSQQHGVPALPIDAQPDAAALQCLSAAACNELNVLPLRCDGADLLLAVLDPMDQPLLQKVANLTQRRVRPVVASEGRLYALLRDVLGIERTPRLAVIEAQALRAGQAGIEQMPLRSILRDQVFPAGADAGAEIDDGLEVITLVEVVDESESLATDTSAPSPPPRVSAFDFEIRTADIQFHVAESPAIDPEVQRIHAALGAAMRPLSFQEVLVAIDTCTDRESLARNVLRYVLWYYRRALIFTVQRGLILGWDGLGDRVDRDLAAKLMIPVSVPSVFVTAFTTRQVYHGPLDDAPINQLFVKILGGLQPTSCHVVPIVVGKRVVAMLYADGCIRELDPAQSSEFAMVASQVRRAFERFIARVDGA